MPKYAKREFEFTHDDFKVLREIMNCHTGIQLADNKIEMIYGRMARRLRKLGLTKVSEYIQILQDSDDSDEFEKFINAVTTNLTSFFRESHHFDYLKDTLLPELMHKNKNNKRIRIWSAGCSTGEEPYSIAMIVAETVPVDWDVKILATDLDTDVLAHAESGVYNPERIEDLTITMRQRWFLKSNNLDKVQVKPVLKDLIYFRQLNLLADWPMKGPIDIIFCRNVIIYFDMETKKTLMERYANHLVESGHLFLGHSEAMNEMSTRFALRGKSVYVKGRC